MAASSPQVILLDSRDHYLLDEGIVAAANVIYPGQLVWWSSGELIRHATADDVSVMGAFAIEWRNIGRGIDDAYAAGETCFFCYPHAGARVYSWLVTAGNVAKGAPLGATGTGSLKAVTTGAIVGWADEAVNNAGGGTGPDGTARIRIRKA